MRIFMPLAALICSLHLAFGAAPDDQNVAPDTFDYVSMLNMSSMILDHFKDRMYQTVEHGGDARLVPADDNERAALYMAMTYMLLSFVRMEQDIMCLINHESAVALLQAMSEQGEAVFNLMPEDVQEVATRLVMQILELSEQAESQWQPSENVELYVPATQWGALRVQVAQEYCRQFEQALL